MLDDVVRWLRGGIAIVLQALATGELALTHEALDTCARHQAAEYLRHRLMACGLLPVHGRHLRAYQSWLRRPCVAASPAADVHPRYDKGAIAASRFRSTAAIASAASCSGPLSTAMCLPAWTCRTGRS